MSVQDAHFNLGCKSTRVSIHPMCRFKIFIANTINSFAIVSIHPMCRFKNRTLECRKVNGEFQYILCVGSRE